MQPDNEFQQRAVEAFAEWSRRCTPQQGAASVMLDARGEMDGKFVDSALADLGIVNSTGISRRATIDNADHYDCSDQDHYLQRQAGEEWESKYELAHEVTRMLAELDAAARDHDDRIRQVLVSFTQREQHSVVVDAEGLREWTTANTYLDIKVVARSSDDVGVSRASRSLVDGGALSAAATGRALAQRALHNLAARPAPSGWMPVVIGPGRGTVLIHEACCHPLEADEVLRGSVYAHRLGQQIAPAGVVILDDGTHTKALAPRPYDDEGNPSKRTVVIDDGVLQTFLTDTRTARRLGLSATSNARRQSYTHPPMPRMSTTVLAAGNDAPEDLIGDVSYGLYAEHVGGGEVTESTGEFVFRVQNGWLIRDGQVTDPVTDTTIAGRGADVLACIDGIGNDPAVGVAVCGKRGQLVPVGLEGPTFRVPRLLVGGTFTRD